MAEGKTNMFGKTYNTIGSTDSNFIIKTKGDLKIQWGNKYIDVIKNGKIVSNDISIFYIVETKDDIKNDGIYLVGEDQLWVSIKGQKFNIPMDETESSGTSYISFLVDQQLKPEEKYRALTNIGFYYKSLNDVKDITSGLVYVEETQKLYIIDKGVLTPYYTVDKTDQSEMSNTLDELWVGPLHLYQQEGYGIIDSSVNMMISQENIPYLILEDETLKVQSSLQMSSDSVLMSENANDYYGYKLYVENEVSTLEIDNIIWRKHPTLITYKELRKRINEKTLAPKLYYLITDFQNPWEVSWDNEPLCYKDEYVEINGELRLSNIRNALQLIVRAVNEEQLEEQAWAPLHPDWVIHYDPYFLGEEHILSETNTQYGYRSRKNTNNEIEYLSCKGQITYLKDEYGNEGNFNFRHLQFKRRTTSSAFVWRYCMDQSEDNVKLLGTFFPGTNNKFKFEELEIFAQVFQCNPVKNSEGIIIDYEIINKDYNIQISQGYSLYINSQQVENNLFENQITNRLVHEIIGTKIIGNQFINVKRIVISEQEEIKNNIIKNIESECRITGELNDNYLDTITISNNILVEKGWKFNKNTIINSSLFNFIQNTSGEFINNTIKDSKITMQYGVIGGIVQNNIFDKIILNISNNNGSILNNEITNSQRVNITNTSNIEKNYFGEAQTIQNNGSLINNIFNKIVSITNKGNIFENNITQLDQLQNTGDINNNTIGISERINNTGTIENNNIINSTNIINSGILSNNNIKQITQLQNNSGTITNNNIEEAQILTIAKQFSDNTINKITINNLYINYDFVGNHIHDINNITISADITNNNINDINGCVIRGSMNNNSFKDINSVQFYKITENNIFNKSLSDCIFQGNTTNNIAYKDIKNMTIYGDLQNCIFKQSIDTFSVRGMENCTLEEINNLSFSFAIYSTTTHGIIGNITRDLPAHEQDLLKDRSKKTEIYPNIEVICVPDILLTGMIIMWHGSTIPKGWWICDGTHGTPDLRGQFIKSAKNISDVGFVEPEDVDINNKIKLKQNQLPQHSHPHKKHTHSITGLSASTEASTVSVTSSGSFAHTNSGTSVSSGVEGASSRSVVNDVDYTTVYSSGGSHSHTVNLRGSLESVASEEDRWQYGTQQSISLEPRHYKIIFIMKIDESEW